MKLFKPLLIALAGVLLAGCASTPVDSQARDVCEQTFGTTEYLKILWLPVGQMDEFFAAAMGDQSDEIKIASAMLPGQTRRVDLVVWTQPHGTAVYAVEHALRYIPDTAPLAGLNFLYVGDAADAQRLRPEIEQTGAKFYFHQQ